MTAVALETAGSPTSPGRNCHLIGVNFLPAPKVGHRVTSDGVTLILPHGRDLTDAEAKKLAWGILADLAPDEVAPTPVVVNYKESYRIGLLTALGESSLTTSDLAARLPWPRRTVERRLRELMDDGRVERVGRPSTAESRYRATEVAS